MVTGCGLNFLHVPGTFVLKATVKRDEFSPSKVKHVTYRVKVSGRQNATAGGEPMEITGSEIVNYVQI